MREFIKTIIGEAVLDEFNKLTPAVTDCFNAYLARLEALEQAVNRQTEALNQVAEALYSVAEIAVETRDYVRSDRDAGDWWKGERG